MLHFIISKQHKQTTVTSYYVTVVFDLPCEFESRFTVSIESGFLIEYPLTFCCCRTQSVVEIGH